jgi:2-phosphoglycerate kinase
MNKDWTVLLIGGSSGVGKTRLAQQLAKRYEISHTETDDLRVGLRTVTNREAHPELFTFVDNQNYLAEFSVQQFMEAHLASAKTVWRALDSIITKHVGFNERVIFDGDSILPSLLATRDQEGIKAIFLYDGLEGVRERQAARNRNKKRTPEKMETNAQFSFAYSEVLREQALEQGFTTIQASPIDSLFDRVVSVLEK